MEHTNLAQPAPRPADNWLDNFMPGSKQGDKGPSGEIFDIRAIRGLLFRQRYLLIATVALALLTGLIITLIATPIYQAETTIRVDTDGANIVEGQNLEAIHANEVYRYMETQGSVIRSRRLALAVTDKLKLYDRPDFLKGMTAEEKPDGVGEEQWAAKRRDAAADKLRAGLEADIPDQNRIVTIRYRSTDPVMAADVANAYATIFVSEDLRRSLEENQYALKYLREQIEDVRARLQEAVLAANAYARRSGIVNQSIAGSIDNDEFGSQNQSITGANLARINATFASARAQRIAAEERWRIVASQPAAQLPEVQNNNAVQTVLARRAELNAQLSELRQRYDDNYPAITDVIAQISAIDRQFASISGDIKNGIRNEYEIALRQEQSLGRELNSLSRRTLDEQDSRVRFELLERDAISLRGELGALLERYNEINSASNLQLGSSSLLDEAVVPSQPISPNLLQNMLLSLMIGAGLAGVLAVLRESFDDRLRSLEDIEDRLGYPVLGQTPYVEDADIAEQIGNPFSPLMEAYSSLRSTLDYALPRDRNVLMVTSSQAGEGKSTTAMVLAQKSAQLGRKTLLIDADLRRPSIARMFGEARPKLGFAEVVLGHTDLASALMPDTPKNLDVLPMGALPPNPVELLSSGEVAKFIAHHRDEYSLIIFDSSPVMGIADAPILTRHVDAAVFVIEANKVQRGQVRDSIRRIRNVGGNLAGVVLSKFRALQAGQSYDYQYRYYDYRSSEAE